MSVHALLVFVLVQADPHAGRVKETAYARVTIAHAVARDALVVKAVTDANSKALTLAEIRTRDVAWVKDPHHPLRKQIHEAPCWGACVSCWGSDPHVVEALVMDAQGALVCSLGETTDYWQGDEPKWQRPFVDGRDPFVDEPAFDQSSGLYAIQVSIPMAGTGGRIGAVTLTLKLRPPAAGPGR